ncbi:MULTISPECIES: hypothetical protein [Weissella]|uniref:Uncharacterized protein n=1 Tax=Weissella confusa TaxID=1583 RepID=A0A923NGI0_WEICO|nr:MULTISPECIES: hypothetical protein [Weissella]AVO65499.1 hypothetical protein C6N67_00030 [Weissella cibaria]MBC6498581.1 hypothetical protein [Weissella confusa]MBJ7620029.1 hypothetical protein [Weissella confusa]MBJ7620992.1 hypothetical protein [Weissella confusa]MBJ7667364.1 hypothetical protein [Weissella confusa]
MADKWEWSVELAKARVNQTQVGEFIGITRSQMSTLVTKMITGEGKTATELDRKRWQQALDYVKLKQQEVEV